MPVRYQDWITEEDMLSNPDTFYVFGDNAQRVGMGGQAKVMRGKPNALGVATKWTPGYAETAYFSDNPATLNKILDLIDSDFSVIVKKLRAGKTAIIPKDGLGTGLAELPKRAPQIHDYIVQWIDYLFMRFNDENH